MNKKLTNVVLILFFMIATLSFSKWTSAAFYLEKENTLSKNKMEKEDLLVIAPCPSPFNEGVKDIKSDEATIYWDDSSGTEWEYIIQLPTDPYPTGPGVPVNTKEVTVTQDNKGNNLTPVTTYEFYVRTDCGIDGFSSWQGPFSFTTVVSPKPIPSCDTIRIFPFLEDFNSTSLTRDCWTIIDVHNDGEGDTNNKWGISDKDPCEGNAGMRIQIVGSDYNLKKADDWLISPPIELKGGTYALSYVYKSIWGALYRTNKQSDMEIRLSLDGPDLDAFKTILLPAKKYRDHECTTKALYIEGIDSIVHIAFRIVDEESYIGANIQYYIDKFSIEEVDCIGPDDDSIEIIELREDKVTFTWEDESNNAEWEYHLLPQGTPLPFAPGNIVSTKEVSTSNLTTGGSIQSNTEYEFYLRSVCGSGKNSLWIGPVYFKTPIEVSLPYIEGFNENGFHNNSFWLTRNLNIKNEKNGKVFGSNPTLGAYYKFDPKSFEGDGFAMLRSNSIDSWLISPLFPTKKESIYKLTYWCIAPYSVYDQVNAKNDPTVEYYNHLMKYKIQLAFGGSIATNNFEKIYKRSFIPRDELWKKEVIQFQGNDELCGIGISPLEALDELYLRIDNITIEEVKCPEPMELTAENIETDAVTLKWIDDFGSKQWEYFVRKVDYFGSPKNINGIKTNQKSNRITLDSNGVPLEQATSYEFYVRTICDDGELSDWAGPYKFKMNCGTFSVPFKETFKNSSKSAACWEILDRNMDGYNHGEFPVTRESSLDTYDMWHISDYLGEKYDGDYQYAFFKDEHQDPVFQLKKGEELLDIKEHDDWLVSPAINFQKNKKYRLKYRFRTPKKQTVEGSKSLSVDLEVLLSTQGINYDDFTTVITPKETYITNDKWKEEITFIENIDGVINITWHILGRGEMEVHIDMIELEEVKGCFEPLNLSGESFGDSLQLSWKDNTGAVEWEYYVQKRGQVAPSDKTSGITITEKEVLVTEDIEGKDLENGEYEFYVRTVCGNGEYSIWQGPYEITICNVYPIPFWESFEDDSKSGMCWQKYYQKSDVTWDDASYKYEGKRAEKLPAGNFSFEPESSYLISPKLKFDKDESYVLKFFYLFPDIVKGFPFDNNLEIVYSTEGSQIEKFNSSLLVKDNYSSNLMWQEKMILIDNLDGDINLAWKLSTYTLGVFYIDNVSLKKSENCLEPYNIEVISKGNTHVNLIWQQLGKVDEWEVLVVPYGENVTSAPVQILKTNSLGANITGLVSGTSYSFFVRSVCNDGKDISEWSTVLNVTTNVLNDSCVNALTLTVNKGTDCIEVTRGSFVGSNLSSIPKYFCGTILGNEYVRDIWFEFTAEDYNQTLSIILDNEYRDLIKDPGTTGRNFLLPVVVYNQDCFAIDGTGFSCDVLNPSIENFYTIRGLEKGEKYYVRILATEDWSDNLSFDLCMSSGIHIESIKETDKLMDLMNSMLVDTLECNLIKNIDYSPKGDVVNIGYFNSNQTSFPFDEGMILATHNVLNSSLVNRFNPHWHTNVDIDHNGGMIETVKFLDLDLREILFERGFLTEKGSSHTALLSLATIDFDFVSLSDSLSFEYIFASQLYDSECSYGCYPTGRGGGMFVGDTQSNDPSAGFVAWLTDLTTLRGEDVAIVPGTDLPVSTLTIRDSNKTGSYCSSSNIEFFGEHYGKDVGPVNYVGMTVPLKSKAVAVVPGRRYHMKMILINSCAEGHSSAVFFNKGSFDLGNFDLGSDLLIETNTALCKGDSTVLQMFGNISESEELHPHYQWLKDGVEIPGANYPELQVNSEGEYTLVVSYIELDCQLQSSVKVEVYPAISDTVLQPESIVICRTSLEEITRDLTMVEEQMFSQSGKEIYTTAYYSTKQEAESETNPIENPRQYAFGKQRIGHIYIRVDNIETGCYEVFELRIQLEQGAIPEKPSDVAVCAEYIFPQKDHNQYYYTEPGGEGIRYQTGHVLTEPGEYIIYLLQVNSEEGCYEETSYKVKITAPVTADVFEDETLSCEYYELKPLSKYNQYFTEPEAQGIELYTGMQILQRQTVYVYASSEDGLCTDESSFTIGYEDCPIPRGISPNNDGLNDVFDLTPHGVESIKIYNRWGTEVYSHGEGYTTQWHGQSKSGKQLPDATYYYVIRAHGKIRTGWVQINK